MFDRLASLKKLTNEIESPALNQEKENRISDSFKEFTNLIDLTKNILIAFKSSSSDIRSIEIELKTAVTSNKEKELLTKLSDIVNYNNLLCEKLKNNLDQLTESIKSREKNDPETRMKLNLINNLMIKSKECYDDYQTAQLSLKKTNNDKLMRQAKIYDNKLTDEVLNKLVEDPEKINELLKAKMDNSSNIFMENLVSDIQNKYNDIKRLEKNVNQVYQLFLDMTLLTQQQGEMIDNIEIAIKDTDNFVYEGEDKLIEAKTEHKKSKKLLCIISVILIIVVCVVCVLMFGIFE